MSMWLLRLLCLLAAISFRTPSLLDAGNNAIGLDRFGRVQDLHFKNGTNTVHKYQYGYDISGNRTYARVTQATIGGTAHDNDRSYLYGYDDLQRLTLDATMNAKRSGL